MKRLQAINIGDNCRNKWSNVLVVSYDESLFDGPFCYDSLFKCEREVFVAKNLDNKIALITNVKISNIVMETIFK